jgi:hypothetical protein
MASYDAPDARREAPKIRHFDATGTEFKTSDEQPRVLPTTVRLQ